MKRLGIALVFVLLVAAAGLVTASPMQEFTPDVFDKIGYVPDLCPYIKCVPGGVENPLGGCGCEPTIPFSGFLIDELKVRYLNYLDNLEICVVIDSGGSSPPVCCERCPRDAGDDTDPDILCCTSCPVEPE